MHCQACDGLPATTVGEVDLSQLDASAISLGNLDELGSFGGGGGGTGTGVLQANGAADDGGIRIGDLGNFGDLEFGAAAPAAPDAAPPLLDDLLFGDEAAAAPAPAAPPVALAPLGTAKAPAARPQPVAGAQGLDLFLGDLPAASSSPLSPLELDLGAPGAPAPAAPAFSLGEPAAAPPPVGFPPPAPAPAAGDPLDIGAMFASLLPQDPAAAPAAPAPVPSPFLTPPSVPITPPADAGAPGAELLPDPGLGNAGLPPPNPAAASSGFSLRLANAAPAAAPAEPAHAKVPVDPRPPRAPAVPGGGSLPPGVARLDPPRKKGETLVATVDAPPRGKLPLIGAGAGLVVVAAVAAFVLGRSGSSESASAALAPFAADLARDHYPAYQKAADAVMAGDDAQASASRRASAAELLLLAALAHGDKSKITKGTELLTDLNPPGEPPPELGRAKALAAVARGRGSEAEGLLGSQASAPDGTLIKAMRRLRERRASDAVAGLRAFVNAAPERLVGQYLLGRALEEAKNRSEAEQSYRKVLAKNPNHAGAAVGILRVTRAPAAERQKKAAALLEKIAATASPAELGEAQTLLGEALLAQGQTGPALETLTRAVAATPNDASAHAALTEALLAEGRAAEALSRLRAIDVTVLASGPGRLAMGAALVSNGLLSEGTAQIEAAAAEMPQDPRAVTWLAVAAENKRPPDDALAVRKYKEALALDPRFLPASLRLAALLQRKGKPAEAIALIKEAEAAGAPPAALSVAWGLALIGAKDPAQAEVVLRKAVAANPTLVTARTGLAAALDAGGKADEAEKELERAITDLPKAPGLRERLAELLARHGKKERALATLDEEAAAGKPSLSLKVAIAKLALELGQTARAATELEVVVTEDPATPEALFTLARTKEAAGDSSGALQEYKRALAFESSPELHLSYGRALALSGRDDEALSQLESAGEIALARLERARIRLKRNEIDEALKEVDAATRLAPNDGRAFFLQGICLDLVGRADDAAAAWKKALAVSPELSEASYRLGRYEMDKGRQESALGHFRNAAARPLGKVAWEADLYFQLGFAEVATGSRGNAVAALRRYLELSAPDAPARPEAEQALARLARK